MPPPSAILLDPRVLGDGWRVVQSDDGSLWRERKVSTDAPAVWGTGLAFWLGGYAAGIIGGMQQGGINEIGWMPIIGAFVQHRLQRRTAAPRRCGPSTASRRRAASSCSSSAWPPAPTRCSACRSPSAPASFVGGGSGVALVGRF